MTAVPAKSRGESSAPGADPFDLLDRLFELPTHDAAAIAQGVADLVGDVTPATVVGVFRDDAGGGSPRLWASSSGRGDRGATERGTSRRAGLRDAAQGRPAAPAPGAPLAEPVRAAIASQLGVPGDATLLWAPIDSGARSWGLLVAAAPAGHVAAATETRVLAACARWMADALARIELATLAREQARELSRRERAEELIVSVAHDFYNFLTPLSSRIELMRRRAGIEERRRDFQDANRAAKSIERLTDMVSDLFDAQRLANGTFTLRREHVDLAALVRDTVDALETGGVKIEVAGMRSLDVVADPRRVRQAIENLVANAIKATPKTGTITVAVKVETRAGSAVAVVTVRDDGPGIPHELRTRLFVRFAAGHDSVGLGLGLYLAREIARAHGGDVAVDSEPGKGSQFHFAIPTGW